MSFERDAALIARVARTVDPAFGRVPKHQLDQALAEVEMAARRKDLDQFLLTAMNAVSLAQNAHTRLIANAAIQVLPLRLVVRDDLVCAAVNGTCQPVVAINGKAVKDLLPKWRHLLPGPAPRQRMLSALMCAWPAALAQAGAEGPDFEYATADGTCLWRSAANRVPAAAYFSENETGAADVGCDPYPASLIQRHDDLWHLRLSDMKALSTADVARIVAQIEASPAGVIVDLRGNPGGNFLTALPLISCLEGVAARYRCAVLVNSYTFSAALVVAALVSFHLAARARLVGAPMGDDMAFWAEGGTIELPDSGAKLRYATGWHDWRTGVATPATPPIIAAHMVAAGDLPILSCPEREQMTRAQQFVRTGAGL